MKPQDTIVLNLIKSNQPFDWTNKKIADHTSLSESQVSSAIIRLAKTNAITKSTRRSYNEKLRFWDNKRTITINENRNA